LIGVLVNWAPASSITAALASPVASPAPLAVRAEIGAAIERARQHFEARDTDGVLAYVSNQYRSQGLTKAAVREQLLAMFALYEALQVSVSVDQIQTVEGTFWVYTTGSVSGRLPLVGRVTFLSWERQPEVARREGSWWRLYGFQD